MEKNQLQQGKYRAIFSDIDGTLLNSSHQIPPKTRAKIQEIVERGIPFVLVSARMPDGMIFIRDALGKPQPMICYSGALVVDEHKQPLYSAHMPQEEAFAVGSFIRQLNKDIAVNLYAGDNWIVENRENPWVKSEMAITKTGVTEADFGKKEVFQGIHKILCMGEAEQIFALEKKLKEKFPALRIYRSKDTYLEIMSMKASKSDAICQLEKYFQVKREEIVAFGDGCNDVDMVKYAGLGVAMENADPAVKTAADLVTLTNDAEGIRKVLDALFMQEKRIGSRDDYA